MNVFQNNVCFFLKLHHSVDILPLWPSTTPHSSFALVLPTVIHHSMFCIYLLHLLLNFLQYVLQISDHLFQLTKITPYSNPHLKGFRSRFRLLSSRCFISILSAPRYKLPIPRGLEGRPLAEPHVNQQATDGSRPRRLL